MKKAEEKIKRVVTALKLREEPDRVPLCDFYWSSFYQNWLQEFDLPPDTDIYKYYDLDLKVISPNMDPKVESCKVIEQNSEYVLFKSGFGCVVKKVFNHPMPDVYKRQRWIILRH